MKLFIAADHGGFALKEKIEYHYDIENKDRDAKIIEVVDLGAHDLNPEDDYPPFAFELAEQVLAARAEESADVGDQSALGILICRSGIGMCIAANKVQGCYAALCFTPEHAEKARQHDHANVLVLDADYLDADEHLAIVHAFIHSQPEPGRHERRMGQIAEYERNHFRN